MRRPLAPVLGAALALVLTGGLLAGQPAAAADAKPSKVGLVTFYAKGLEGTDRAYLKVEYPKAKHATKYEIFVSTTYDGVLKKTTPTRRTSNTRVKIGGLKRGRDYFVMVRGTNGKAKGTRSSSVGHATIGGQGAGTGPTYSVMTYNVCSDKCSGWSKRAPAVAERIGAHSADVVATQEAGYLAVPPGYTQAVYKSAKRLMFKTSRFDVATVDGKPRVGSVFLGYHGGGNRWAVWAELVDKATGDRTMFVNAHLVTGSASTQAHERRAEVLALFEGITAANPEGLPVVHAGDYNSNRSRGYDSVRNEFMKAGYLDTYENAAKLTKQHHNSYNGFSLTPRTSVTWGDHVDKVFVDPATSRTRSWVQGERFSGTKYAAPLGSDHSPVVVSVQLD